MFRAVALACLLASATACGTTSETPDAGLPANCTALDAAACSTPIPSYSTDIAPLLDRACNTTCHAPGVGPWPLTNYNDVTDWASIIQGDIATCSMPPMDAGAGNGNLSDPERAMLLDWLACGSPNN